MIYQSTRNDGLKASSAQAILDGIAKSAKLGREIEIEIPEGTTAQINLLDKINETCAGGIYKFIL